jgi:hypothetical protein
LPIAGKKFPRLFQGYLEFFEEFQNVYSFNSQFLTESWLGNEV